MFGVLNQNWHNVPAGTALEIVSTEFAFSDTVHICRRVDGENLPMPRGPSKTARIVAKFITFTN